MLALINPFLGCAMRSTSTGLCGSDLSKDGQINVEAFTNWSGTTSPIAGEWKPQSTREESEGWTSTALHPTMVWGRWGNGWGEGGGEDRQKSGHLLSSYSRNVTKWYHLLNKEAPFDQMWHRQQEAPRNRVLGASSRSEPSDFRVVDVDLWTSMET